jgi:hypothetical protein
MTSKNLNQKRGWGLIPAAVVALALSSGLNGLHAQAVSNRLFAENFEGLALGPNREEGRAGLEVWTATPPTGWVQDNTGMPGFGTANDGIVEWAGWTFANKDWWVAAAGNQRRAEFAFGSGTVMIADPDEWDDASHAPGLFNAYVTLPPINTTGAAANSLILAFDSTWRPEAFDDGAPNFPVDENGRPTNHQNGVVDAWFGTAGGTTNRVIDFDSDSESPNFKRDGDFINESAFVPLNNPAGTTSLNLRFGMLTAANDWWWAVDNIAVGYPPLLASVTGNGVAVTNRIVEALGKTVNEAAGITVTVNGTTVTPVEVSRSMVNDNVPDSERLFVAYTGTTVFPPRSRVNVTVRYTDNTGRLIEDAGSFVAPGYLSASATPRVVTAVLTDAEWLTINEAAGVQLELNGTSVTPSSVVRSGTQVLVNYTSPTLLPSNERYTVRATYRSATGQVLTETVGFTTPTYATLNPAVATAAGTAAEAGMVWRTHQSPTNRPTTIATVENQLAGLLGPSVHDASGEVNGVFPIELVNFDQAGGEAGNFRASGAAELAVADGVVPGLPGGPEFTLTDNVVGEARAFIEIPTAGLYTMVVNSDDGFRLTVGTTNNPTAQVLGVFDGGRGSADSLIYFNVTQPGVYFFRLVWMEGGGGANVEWFTVNSNGTRALVNGTQTGALRAFRRRTVAEPVPAVSNRLFAENFEGLALGPNREEGRAGLEVWTATPPTGWVQDNTGMPGFGTANDGIVEWAGWTFANKDWWVAAAGNQRRAEFAFGSGTVMIADPDEWDDASHAPGLFNAYVTLPPINTTGAAANSLILAFDSTWRPEAFDDGAPNFPVDENGRPTNHQNGVVDAWFGTAGGTTNRVIDFDSDSESPNFKRDGDFINESAFVPLNNPAGTTSLNLRFGMLTAANDWWWAVDNIAVGYPPLLASVTGNGVAVTNRIVEALGKTVNEAAGITVTVNGTTVTPVEVSRSMVNDNVPDSERLFVAYTGTTVFPPRSRVNVTVRYTDNTGRLIEDAGSFVAPGYLSASATPRVVTAVLTDAEWLTINEAAGVQLELNGTSVTPSSVVRSGTQVLVNYTSPTLLPSNERYTVRATYRSATGQVLTETVGFTTPTYATLNPAVATAAGTAAEAGMVWRTHQSPTNRPTTIATVENQLAGLLGPSVHDASGEVNGVFPIELVNFDQAGGEAGNFRASGAAELAVADGVVPGLPGGPEFTLTDNVVGEARAFIEIPTAGLYTMVVNSDDGFRLTVGTTNNPTAQVLGVFDGGRGSADSLIYFNVTQPGVYFFRLVWMEGGGGANVEWFTVNNNGTRALVNGTQTGALRAFRRRTVAEPGTSTGGRIQSIARNGANVVITYTGTLKSATTLNGPFTNVSGATSPATITPSEAFRFYRAE